MGTIAAALIWLIQELITSWGTHVLGYVSFTPPWIIRASLILTLSAAVFSISRGRLLAFLGIRRFGYFLRFPPLWVGAAIGVVEVVVLGLIWERPYVNHYEVEVYLDCAATTLVALTLVVFPYVPDILAWFRQSSSPPDSTNSRSTQFDFLQRVRESPATLETWLASGDDPIADVEEDYFGHRLIAQRIVHRLRQSSSGSAHSASVAVSGKRGSGKTSLLNLCKHYDESSIERSNSRPLLWSHVTASQYVDARSLMQGLLRHAVDRIGDEANYLSIKSVPSAYIQAVSTINSFVGQVVGHVVFADSSPERVIARMDGILTALDLHLVIWLDDIGRYSRAQERAQEDTLLVIESLLWLIKDSPRISLVVAVEKD